MLPLWRASRYAAYQSHQSCGGATASNEPWCSAVSCSRAASAATSMSVLPLPPGDPGRDLLEQPAVAIWVAERRVCEVGAACYRLEAGGSALVHLADVDAPADEIGPGGVDVGDREDQPVSGPWRSRGEALAEVDRALRARRRELHPPDVVANAEVGVQPPAEALVEALRPVDIGDRLGDRQRHDLEPQRDGRGTGHGNPHR